MYVCPVCLNQDEKYIGYKNNKPYCRKCITFNGSKEVIKNSPSKNVAFHLDYQLSIKQQEVSNNILKAYQEKKNVLLHAVCGAGKTELVFQTIEYCLKLGNQVGIAIPRKDVVIELTPRIKKAFPNSVITSVYGGHTKDLVGDIILLTTHQLYRYKEYFDFLVIDETDAFPFADNDLLHQMFNLSLKGTYVMMSATPLPFMEDKIKKEKGVILNLFQRYHGHPLIEPKYKVLPLFKYAFILYQLKKFLKDKKPVLVFTPTIEIAENTYNFLKVFLKYGNVVHSKKEDREKLVQDFKDGELKYLVTTSILERGITIKNMQVIVSNSDHPLYNQHTLIQISGRVGRKSDAYDGEVIYVCSKVTESMRQSVLKIKEANAYL